MKRRNKVAKLNQIIAIEKGIKSKACSEITQLHKKSQKPELFLGFSKTYRKKDEDGDDFPAEKKNVLIKTEDSIKSLSNVLSELIDITAIKDYTNCKATSDVVIDGEIIIEKAPATFLLFLEKQITDIRTFINQLPVLDEAEDWFKDINSGLYKTGSISTHRTKKVQKPIVLYEATKEHPAQTQILTEDIIVGYWDTIKLSSALPFSEKKKILEKIDKFSKAIKFARENANNVICENKNISEKMFKYLFE